MDNFSSLRPKKHRSCLIFFFVKQWSVPLFDMTPILHQQSSEFSFSKISSEEVSCTLKRLNYWKASGLDEFSHPSLQESAEETALPLSYIFNLSLVSGVFPSKWKTAKVQPVFKCKGDRNSPMSYRPISLLSCISKVFE